MSLKQTKIHQLRLHRRIIGDRQSFAFAAVGERLDQAFNSGCCGLHPFGIVGVSPNTVRLGRNGKANGA